MQRGKTVKKTNMTAILIVTRGKMEKSKARNSNIGAKTDKQIEGAKEQHM